MKIGYYNNTNNHLVRLVEGFRSCGADIGPAEAGKQYDIVFIDPSSNVEELTKANVYLFFDCEDTPYYFNPGKAYERHKDKVSAYAKIAVTHKYREDDIPDICFPIVPYLSLNELARADFSGVQHVPKPFMCATPTWLTHYTTDKYLDLARSKNTSNLTPINKVVDPDGTNRFVYNQRADWLSSLRRSNVTYKGGIVFHPSGCCSVTEQSKLFGPDISTFSTSYLSYNRFFEQLLLNTFSLCPTGHDRLSWRVFDIMAAGSILVWTDVNSQRHLYSPKAFIKVKDEEDLATVLQNYSAKDIVDLKKQSAENKKVLAELTPEKILRDFMKQLN